MSEDINNWESVVAKLEEQSKLDQRTSQIVRFLRARSLALAAENVLDQFLGKDLVEGEFLVQGSDDDNRES